MTNSEKIADIEKSLQNIPTIQEKISFLKLFKSILIKDKIGLRDSYQQSPTMNELLNQLNKSFYDSKISEKDELIQWIDSQIESLGSAVFSKTEHLKELKAFKRGELLALCKKEAKKLELNKDEELKYENIKKITNNLIHKGYDAKLKSTGSTLRKLGYKKYTI